MRVFANESCKKQSGINFTRGVVHQSDVASKVGGVCNTDNYCST